MLMAGTGHLCGGIGISSANAQEINRKAVWYEVTEHDEGVIYIITKKHTAQYHDNIYQSSVFV